MIKFANARMYSVDPVTADLWGRLLMAIADQAGVPLALMEHPAPAPMTDLWRRPDKGAVFMCGLPFALADPPPVLVAAPVPAPAEFGDRAEYWSEFVVRADSDFATVEDTFGHRIAFTVPDSQSGCVAALHYFHTEHLARGSGVRASTGWPPDGRPPDSSPADRLPLYREVIAPTITPLGALTAVVRGAADVAPIDAYAFALLRRYRSDLTSQVRVVGRTGATAIPPLVASEAAVGEPAAGDPAADAPVAGEPPCDALQAAFLAAHRDPAMRRLMDGLALRRFARPDRGGYSVLRERFEAAARFWHSHALATVMHPAFVTDRR